MHGRCAGWTNIEALVAALSGTAILRLAGTKQLAGKQSARWLLHVQLLGILRLAGTRQLSDKQSARWLLHVRTAAGEGRGRR
jgi:hypothetical protein